MQHQLLINQKAKKQTFVFNVEKSKELDSLLCTALSRSIQLKMTCKECCTFLIQKQTTSITGVLREQCFGIQSTIDVLKELINSNATSLDTVKVPSKTSAMSFNGNTNRIIYELIFSHKELLMLLKKILGKVDAQTNISLLRKINEQIYFHKKAYLILDAFLR